MSARTRGARRAARAISWAGIGVVGSLAQAAGSTGANSELAGNLVAELLVLFGCVFLLAAAIGMVRFPDFYTRLHASTKLVTLGGVGIFGGSAIAFAPLDATGRVLLIAGFFFLTAPLSGYMIARSGYLRGLVPAWEPTSVDDWGALGTATHERAPEGDGNPDDEIDAVAGSGDDDDLEVDAAPEAGADRMDR